MRLWVLVAPLANFSTAITELDGCWYDAGETGVGRRGYVVVGMVPHGRLLAAPKVAVLLSNDPINELKVGFKDDYDDDVAAVEARRPETVRVKKTVMMVKDEDDDDVEVDSRADDFINKFMNDLKSQRIESIMKKNGKK
ncbi:Myb-like protein AA [Tanacetum coccineum]